MDIQRKGVGKRKVIRWTVTIVVLLAGGIGITVALKGLKPAAPSVEMSTLWPDTVKRGPMLREVRGLGTLVPEDTMLITAITDGRIQRILIRPGTPVKADSVVMIMTNPDLENTLIVAEFAMKSAQADYDNLKVTLEKSLLDMQSTQAQVTADYNTAKLQAERDMALAKENLLANVDAQISEVKAKELEARLKIEQQRLATYARSEEAQLAMQKVKIDQLKADYDLKKSQVDQLKVRAGFDGVLQAVPPPEVPVEEGQKVAAGKALGKVAQPWHLKAELKIAETQVKDIVIGQPAEIDTRLAGGGDNGKIVGKVSRKDPSVLNGTVTVDV